MSYEKLINENANLKRALNKLKYYLIWETAEAYCEVCNEIWLKKYFVDRICCEICIDCAKSQVIAEINQRSYLNKLRQNHVCTDCDEKTGYIEVTNLAGDNIGYRCYKCNKNWELEC
jgi:hypothetical protein